MVLTLRPAYERKLVKKCPYCTACEERDRNGWLVHIDGKCTCTYSKRIDHYELIPVDDNKEGVR